MTLSFGPPIDPAYTRFLEGLKRLSKGKNPNERWDAKSEHWYTYDPAKWGMEDLGLTDTSAEQAFRKNYQTFPQLTWEITEIFVDDLFLRLRKVGASYMKMYPHATLVWVPWGGGDWRAAFERTHPSPLPPPLGSGPLPPECVKSIQQVQEYARRGFITHDQKQRLIESIIAECT
jgi:hypothetical protein